MNAKKLNHKNEWSWINHNGVIYLQSKLLLKNGFSHAFFTKQNMDRRNPKALNSLINDKYIVHFSKQIHSNKVIYASSTKSNQAEADSIISDKSNQSLWLYTADCIPILIGDKATGHVATIHSGWRGLTNDIMKNTINKLYYRGSKKESLIIALGPAISCKNYQINLSIAKRIYQSLNLIKSKSEEEIIRSLLSKKCIQYNSKNNKIYLDIRNTAKIQLSRQGINEDQISVNSDCTFSMEEFFESWRREETERRQWSFIASNDFTRDYNFSGQIPI